MYHFRKSLRSLAVNQLFCPTCIPKVVPSYSFLLYQYECRRNKRTDINLSALFIPVAIKPNIEDDGIGKELTGTISKTDIAKVLNKFYQRPEVKALSLEQGLDSYLQHQAYLSFRKFCLESECLPADVHIVISDILKHSGHITDIYPYFLRHAKQMFPHLECMDDLKRISDLTSPPSWYSEARRMKRKIILHAGPTNSGKTYHALERFLSAKSGVYCGPLKLLATEVYKKANEKGTPCDLVTGEERKFALGEANPASHISCTVEMASINTPYEVAVIDEIQLVRDPQRGWAWTRALLGLMAEEIHLCGEAASYELLSALAVTCNEEIELKEYKRLTNLTIETTALGSLENVKPGDCIVCFSKNDIYAVSRGLEEKGHEAAVIYGGLPPGTKLAQAQKFNDPDNPCKLMVATDAIGMGLNLSIGRVIFYSLTKPMMNEKGEKEIDIISISQALQIAGRAGRYGTQFEKGFVTTYRPEDLAILQNLLSQSPEPILKAGLHPTAEQIELYAYHLPHSTLSNLIVYPITKFSIKMDNLGTPAYNTRSKSVGATMLDKEVIPPSEVETITDPMGHSTHIDIGDESFTESDESGDVSANTHLDSIIQGINEMIQNPDNESIFEGICTVDDSLYFMCNMDDFKYLADMIQHVPLPLRSRYVFCCAPINRKMPFVCSMFLKFARQFSRNDGATFSWLCRHIGTPFSIPNSIGDLVHLESVFDVLDLYLWLSTRFTNYFPAVTEVRNLQMELDTIIQQGVSNITRLIRTEEQIKESMNEEAGVMSEGRSKRIPYGRGKLSDRLVAEGLLTPDLMNQLKKEIKKQALQIADEETSVSKKLIKRKRKPKIY